MSKSIRLITDEVLSYLPDPSTEGKFVEQKSHIVPRPRGKFTVVGYVTHKRNRSKVHPFVNAAIQHDIGILYLCDHLPEKPIHHPNVHYLVCPDKWFIHTLFMNPLQFSAVFASKAINRLSAAFSEFTGYNIPRITRERDFKKLSKDFEKNKNNILVEIKGGVGDHLMTIPTLKTLASKGHTVHVLCDPHRNPCFHNLDYIKKIHAHRREVNISHYSDVLYLHFGQHLNDYRLDYNKQNRIYSIANVCGLNKKDLVIDRPEIILTKDELNNAKRKYELYPNKIFIGADSARVDSKLPNDMTQKAINYFKSKGFTVFTSSARRREFKNCIDLNKKTSLRELFSLIAVMDCVLTVDTAFLHIAAAFEKPTVCLMSYFKPEWRCGTYKNCTAVTPNVSCHPCVSKQFVPSCEWKCHNKSCYSYYDWNDIYLKVKNLKKNFKPTNIKTSSGDKLDDSKPINESKLPAKVIPVRNQKPRKRIAAFWMGGLGDGVMLGYLCRAIKRRWPGCTIDAFVRDVFQTQLFVFDYPDIKGQYCNKGWRQTIKEHRDNYDVSYEFSRYPVRWDNYKSVPQNINKELYNDWSKAASHILKTWDKSIFEYYASETGLDLVESDMKIPILNSKDPSIDQQLERYKIKGSYITVNSGCDDNVGIMKLWSRESWEKVISKLSEKGVQVIQIGNEKDKTIPGARKVTAKNAVDLMYLIERSKLHVGNEGGLVHLAHALNTKSVVLFGPTDPNLYGYPDNKNLYTYSCPSCWWRSGDWSKNCREGYSSCVNLDKLSVSYVFNSIMEEL